MDRPKILVIGEAMVDVDIHYELVKQADPGYPVLRRMCRRRRPGGAALVVRMASALGADVHFIGRCPGWPIPKKTRHVLGCSVLWREDSEANIPAAVNVVVARIKSFRPSPDVILVSDYGKGLITESVWGEILRRFRNQRILVDPAYRRPADFYQGAWAITPNRMEEDAANYRAAFERVVAKRDREGIVISDCGTTLVVPSEAESVVDACGAGDQFFAVLGVLLARGVGFVESARLANSVAGIQVGRWGTQPLTWKDIPQLVARNL